LGSKIKVTIAWKYVSRAQPSSIGCYWQTIA